MNKKWNCIGFGLCAYDYLAIVEDYPALNQKTDAIDFSQQGGGPVATAMATLGRLNLPKIAFVGKIGTDTAGHSIRSALEQDSVDTRYIKVASQVYSAQAFVWIDRKSGKRSVVLSRDQKLKFREDEIEQEPFADTKFLLIDGRETDASLKAAEITKNAGGVVVMDAGSMRDKIDSFFELVDIFICSQDFVKEYCAGEDSKEVMKHIHHLGCKQIVTTLGEKGSVGYNGSQFFYEPALQIKIIDTTGAGDVYHGAFIYGLYHNWELPHTMRFANAVAALKCRQLGGRAGIPHLDEVKSFMGEHESG